MSEVIPVPTKFAHLVLKTSRFNEQRKFYQDFLGARIVHEAPGIVFLSYDDEHHRLAIMERPGLLPKLKNMAGVDHHAYTYDTLENLLITCGACRPMDTSQYGARTTAAPSPFITRTGTTTSSKPRLMFSTLSRKPTSFFLEMIFNRTRLALTSTPKTSGSVSRRVRRGRR